MGYVDNLLKAYKSGQSNDTQCKSESQQQSMKAVYQNGGNIRLKIAFFNVKMKTLLETRETVNEEYQLLRTYNVSK